MTGKTEFQQLADRHLRAAFGHTHHNTVRVGGLNDLPQRRDGAEDLAAGHGRAGFLAVAHISHHLQARFRVVLDVFTDIFQQRAGPHQQ